MILMISFFIKQFEFRVLIQCVISLMVFLIGVYTIYHTYINLSEFGGLVLLFKEEVIITTLLVLAICMWYLIFSILNFLMLIKKNNGFET